MSVSGEGSCISDSLAKSREVSPSGESGIQGRVSEVGETGANRMEEMTDKRASLCKE